MWIKIQVLLCCILATTLASNDQPAKKADDSRNKRTLEYSVSHHHHPGLNYRSERRLSNGFPTSQAPQYPLFYPVQKPFTAVKKGRSHAGAPPYAVQMEPLVHYSQRDPLYDPNAVPGGTTNDIKQKDDLIREFTHNARVSYAYPPAKHVIERPVYIKEPEPIIEIIIKESNITLPPLPTPPVTLAPRKKEQVQVFYVKYKKNPNAYGKESIIYDKPVPALAPHVPDEPEPIQHPLPAYEALHTATVAPPPSTTLRAIVKPDSEVYHADKGIHITFGKTVNEQRKRSHTDNKNGESAPHALSNGPNAPISLQPQARQFNPFPNIHPQTFFPNRQSPNVNFDNQRFPNHFRNGPPPAAFKQPQFNFPPNSVANNPQPQPVKQPNFPNQAFLPYAIPPQQFAPTHFNNQPIHPVPYQPFEQLRNTPQPQFPKPLTHFPVNQPNPQPNLPFGHVNFQQPQFQNPPKHIPAFQPLPQQPPSQTFSQHFNQQPFNNNQQQQNQPQKSQTANSELIQSLPKFEQHISVPTQAQPQNFGQPHQQQQQKSPQLQQLHQFQLQQQQHLQHLQQLQQQPQLPQNYNRNQQETSALSQQQNRNNQIPQIQKNVLYHQPTFIPTVRPTTTTYKSISTTTAQPSTTEGRLTEEDLKTLNIQLPDEVPDDLRQQLLSSGILKNAQISVLDYDKVGDTSIADLPPDQLANFFSAGGGQQIAARSENKEVVVKRNGELVSGVSAVDDSDMEESESAPVAVKVPAPVEMKVVRFDPKSEEGQKVPKTYIQEGATQVDPVALDDQQYNRYLPVKVNGAAFPIPDVPELKGRSISSVVVLAPVDLNVQENQRKTRDVNQNNKVGRKLAAEALKTLINNPSTENFKDWLDKENQTVVDKQAVILLVTGDETKSAKEKEIFMYDLATQTVSKLSGELSSAFVDAAETNAQQNLAPLQAASSNLIETKLPFPQDAISEKDLSDVDLDEGASEIVHDHIPIIDADSLSDASEQLKSFVDISGIPLQEDLLAAASTLDVGSNKISMTSGYSKTGSSKLFSN